MTEQLSLHFISLWVSDWLVFLLCQESECQCELLRQLRSKMVSLTCLASYFWLLTGDSARVVTGDFDFSLHRTFREAAWPCSQPNG